MTNCKEALKIRVTPSSSDLTNPTSSGDSLSFISFLEQELNLVGRNLPTAGLSLLIHVQLVTLGWEEAWRANHTGRYCLNLGVS